MYIKLWSQKEENRVEYVEANRKGDSIFDIIFVAMHMYEQLYYNRHDT